MTRVAFIHDHEFIFDGIDAYSHGKLSQASFERYLEFFDKLTIISRYKFLDASFDEACYNKVTNENIDFICFDNQSNLLNRFILRYKFRLKLKKIIQNYDALIIRVPSEIGFLASQIALELKIPYVCEVVACPADAMDGFKNLKSKLYKNILVKTMKDTVLNSTGSLYVTRNFLQNRYPTTGFTAIASNVEIERVADCKAYSKKKSYQLVLTGNLDSFHKGYDILFSALEIIDNKLLFKIKLFLVGKGSTFKRTFSFKNVEVEYPGVLDRKRLFNLLDESDLYLQPSNQEGLPRATIEAMSRGLPCIVSNAGGLPELVDEKFVHAKDSPEELAQKILSILSSKEDYESASLTNITTAKLFLTKELKEHRRLFYGKLRGLC